MKTTRLVLRTAGTAFCLAAAITAAAGCDMSDPPVRTDTRSYEVTDTFATLSVDSKGGRIDLVAAAGNTTRVTETIRYDREEPKTRHVVQGGRLVVDNSGCPDSNDECEVSYVIEVPAGLAAHLDSGGGEVTLRGLSGDLEVESGGGEVTADAIASRDFVARTGGGAAHIAFTAGPDRVDLDTAGGTGVVRLPEQTYAVDLDADGGDDRVAVVVDPASPRTIGIRTHGGDASVEPAGR